MVRLWICALAVVAAGCQLPHDFGCDAGGQCGPGAYCGSDALCHAGSTGTLGSTNSAATTVGNSGSTTVMGASSGASQSTSGQFGMASTGVTSAGTTGGSSGVASGGAEAGASGTTSSKPGATSGGAAGSAVGNAASSTTGSAVGAAGSATGSTTGSPVPPSCGPNVLLHDGGLSTVVLMSGVHCLNPVATLTGMAVFADGSPWASAGSTLYKFVAAGLSPGPTFTGITVDSLSSWPDGGLLFGDFDAGRVYVWDGGAPQVVLSGAVAIDLTLYNMRPTDVLHTAEVAEGEVPGFYVASPSRPALSELEDVSSDPDEIADACPAATSCFSEAGCIESVGQIDLDSANDLFVTDPVCNAIGKLTPASGAPSVTAFAGASVAGCSEGQVTVATFNGPTGIAVDRASGTIYVADRGNHAIRRIDASGTVTTLLVTDYDGGLAAAGFLSPKLLAFFPPDELYEADESGCVVGMQVQ